MAIIMLKEEIAMNYESFLELVKKGLLEYHIMVRR